MNFKILLPAFFISNENSNYFVSFFQSKCPFTNKERGEKLLDKQLKGTKNNKEIKGREIRCRRDIRWLDGGEKSKERDKTPFNCPRNVT